MSPSERRVGTIDAIVVFIVALLSLTVGASCFAMPGGEDTTTVTDENNGGEIVVAKGSTLVVRLEATPGTGHGWQVVKNNADLLKPLGKSEFETPRERKPGAPEHQVFRFKAQVLGSTVLELHYRRPWEKDVPPLKTYRIRVKTR